MRWFLLAFLLALPFAAPASPADQLQRAKDLFEYGEYEEARRLAEDLLARNVLASDEDLIDANRVVALSYLYGDRPDRLEKAQQYFLQLLSVEPDYRLDPFFTPPAALEFFDRVRSENEERLSPIREQRRLAKQARAAEEAARRRFLEQRARELEHQRPSGTRYVQKNHMALIFLPFGVGQFQNGDRTAGVAIASIQLAAGLTSLGSFLMVEGLKNENGRFAREDLRAARAFNTTKWISAGLFYAVWVYGVLDAWRGYEPEVILDAPSIVPQVSPLEDGASLGISLRF